MAGKAVAITLICAVLAFVPLTWLTEILRFDDLGMQMVVTLLMDLVLVIVMIGGFIISAIEKNTAAKQQKPQDSVETKE